MMSLLLLVCVAGAPLVAGWVNTYDGNMHFKCPVNQMMANARSQHSNYAEDRRWAFGCRNLPFSATVSNCAWTGYANDFDRPMYFTCPNQGFIAGVRSHHSSYYEDRRFEFMCCEPAGYVARLCEDTPFVNDFDGYMDYATPHGKVMTGWTSFHSNYQEDRQFKFKICEYRAQA